MRRLLLIALMMLVSVQTIHAQDTVEDLKERIIDIQNRGELGFRNFTLCTNILGYGQFVASQDNTVKAGGELLVYYEPANVFTNRRAGGYHIWYTQDMILLGADGSELYNGPEILNFNYQTASPVLDLYATNSLNLGQLPPGKYVFKAVLYDKLKNVKTETSIRFQIVP